MVWEKGGMAWVEERKGRKKRERVRVFMEGDNVLVFGWGGVMRKLG